MTKVTTQYVIQIEKSQDYIALTRLRKPLSKFKTLTKVTTQYVIQIEKSQDCIELYKKLKLSSITYMVQKKLYGSKK